MDCGHFLLFIQQTCSEGLPCAVQGPVVPWSHARLVFRNIFYSCWVNNLELSVQPVLAFLKNLTFYSSQKGRHHSLWWLGCRTDSAGEPATELSFQCILLGVGIRSCRATLLICPENIEWQPQMPVSQFLVPPRWGARILPRRTSVALWASLNQPS